MKNSFEPEKFYLVGNNLAVDFVNSTMFDLTKENLSGWAIAVGLLEAKEAKTLLPQWNEKEIKEISAFRASLRTMIEDLARGRSLKSVQIETINKILRQKDGYAELRKTAQGFVKHFEIDFDNPKKLLVPIAENLVDLVCFGSLDYLRKCEAENCVLHFYDTTKNHRRRWCSMAICGNRAKAAAFYSRKKKFV